MEKQRLEEIKAIRRQANSGHGIPYMDIDEALGELIAEVERLQELQAQCIAENTKMMTAIRERDILLAMSKPK